MQIGKAVGKLKNFIIEPFVPHKQVNFSTYYWIIYVYCNCKVSRILEILNENIFSSSLSPYWALIHSNAIFMVSHSDYLLCFFISQDEESYVCIYSSRHADTILFYHEGGVDIGDVDAKALKLDVPVGESVNEDIIKEKLLTHVPASKKRYVYSR